MIGGLIVDNDVFDDIGDLKAEFFLHENHRIIYAEIVSMIAVGKTVDVITLAESLSVKGVLKKIGELAYIGSLVQSVGSTKNIKRYAEIVMSEFKRRKVKSLLVDLSGLVDGKADIGQITERAESGLFDLLEDDDSSGMAHVGSAVAEAVDWEDEEHKGLDTGLFNLDKKFGGMNKSNLIIIAGRPSMGKSALAMQIAEHVSQHESVIIFSLEMPKREVAARFINYHQSIVDRSEAVRYLYGLNLHIDDTPAITLGHVRSRCRKIKRKHGLSLIVVDYIQLMNGDGDNRTQEIGSISRGLKAIAKEFDIPVIALSQLSRRVEERGDKRPLMSDLRDSGEIEQDADMVLFIYRDEVYDKNSDFFGYAEIICRKSRNGPTGDVLTTFKKELTRFGNYKGEEIKQSNQENVRKGFVC